MKLDLTPYSIRVMLQGGRHIPSRDNPHDMLGTVLNIRTMCPPSKRMVADGRILEVLSTRHYAVAIEVRWDNDTRNTYSAGQFLFRSWRGLSLCNNIWGGEDFFEMDKRPLHTITPRTHLPEMHQRVLHAKPMVEWGIVDAPPAPRPRNMKKKLKARPPRKGRGPRAKKRGKTRSQYMKETYYRSYGGGGSGGTGGDGRAYSKMEHVHGTLSISASGRSSSSDMNTTTIPRSDITIAGDDPERYGGIVTSTHPHDVHEDIDYVARTGRAKLPSQTFESVTPTRPILSSEIEETAERATEKLMNTLDEAESYRQFAKTLLAVSSNEARIEEREVIDKLVDVSEEFFNSHGIRVSSTDSPMEVNNTIYNTNAAPEPDEGYPDYDDDGLV